ncbi:sigma-70 family RNA polymerase sigma factor [Streptomyces griseobrunneus]|uniref:sigma-70 family RNA polymerase sigma factor n=1 Tax=Streptomyces microflavus TaxID=1919 RepID=UPI0037F15FD7
MTDEDEIRRRPEFLSEEQAVRMFAGMNEVIRAGEEMRQLRSEMLALFAGAGWTQERIARLTGMSQPAVSKQVTKHGPGGPRPLAELTLDQYDTPWLEGRLWGLAEEVSEALSDNARCSRFVDALGRGRKRFTPLEVDALRRLVEEDLTLHREELPGCFRTAYDVISRGLDAPAKVTAPGSASARRTLAHRIQRDRLGGGN